MQRQELIQAIKNSLKNSIIKIQFINGVGGAAPRSQKDTIRNLATNGQFKVIGPRVGKGQGGSLLMDLISIGNDPQLIEIATPYCEEIVSIELSDGTFYGFKNENDIPKKYPIDIMNARDLKEKVKFLVKEKMITNYKLDIKSTEPYINKRWEIKTAKTTIGKYGEIRFDLVNGNETLTFGTHSHSSVVSDIDIYFGETKLS